MPLPPLPASRPDARRAGLRTRHHAGLAAPRDAISAASHPVPHSRYRRPAQCAASGTF